MAFATFDNSQVDSLMPHKSMTEVWVLDLLQSIVAILGSELATVHVIPVSG